MQPGTRPLDEQALVLALHSSFGAVSPHRREPQQGIERETPQGASVGTDAQITLGDQGVPEQRHSQSTRGGEPRQRGIGRIEPDQSCSRHQEFSHQANDLRTEVRQQA